MRSSHGCRCTGAGTTEFDDKGLVFIGSFGVEIRGTAECETKLRYPAAHFFVLLIV